MKLRASDGCPMFVGFIVYTECSILKFETVGTENVSSYYIGIGREA